MAEKSPKPSSPPKARSADSQYERWLKYGSNVVVAIIAAVVLAGLIVYVVQSRLDFRHDTTLNGAYSLTPQSKKYIENLNAPVKLVSLYTGRHSEEEGQRISNPQDYARAVNDLLSEYERDGNRISTEVIDPVDESGKLDDLFTEVAKKYGNDTKVYAEVSAQFPKAVDQINKSAADEVKTLNNVLSTLHNVSSEVAQTLQDVDITLNAVPVVLQQIQDGTQRELDLHPKTPNYSRIAEGIRDGLNAFDQRIDAVVQKFKAQQKDPSVPQALRDYMTSSIPRYEAMKKPAVDLLETMKNLGKIKQLEDLREQHTNSIVVMGPTDMKVLSFDQVWPLIQSHGPHASDRRRFAGEQQITTAIIGLTMPQKPKVVFIRPGGPPLTMTLDPQSPAPFAAVAQRLSDYNFDVMDKDITGSWTMQAMQLQARGIPVPPEPKDADIADAVWVVVSYMPAITQQGPNPLSAKLAEHLNQGGSAVVLGLPDADPLESALKPWGITMHADEIAIHQNVRSPNQQEQGSNFDPIDSIRRERQAFFILNQYSDFPVVKPLNDTAVYTFLPEVLPVTDEAMPGYSGTPLLRLPEVPQVWATHQVEKVLRNDVLNYDPKATGDEADVPPPIFAGAAVEKIAKPSANSKTPPPNQRLLVLGDASFAANQLVLATDPTSTDPFPLFPGNGDLFCNSVLWASHMDSMIAISPSEVNISRIGKMSDSMLKFWHYGVLVILLPLSVLLAASFVYLRRRG